MAPTVAMVLGHSREINPECANSTSLEWLALFQIKLGILIVGKALPLLHIQFALWCEYFCRIKRSENSTVNQKEQPLKR
ncbi:hypothetical protein KFU94_09380 [Chloroflexi bacterium TSY]|nr:hypothetical protein [Chloroflexi bacterium TSY]